MNLEIMKGALLGAVASLLIAFVFKKPKNDKLVKMEKFMVEEIKVVEKKTLMERWSVRLALLGFGLGIFAGLGLHTTQIGFMIGLGLPMSLVLGLIGLVIDFFQNRKK
jgi:hypothetical protein